MKRIIASIALAVMTVFGMASLSPANAAPVSQAPAVSVPMGNGTNNFYLSGQCSTPFSWVGIKLKATNWDYGSSQQYHLASSRSGSAYIIDGVYLGGVLRGTGVLDRIITMPGHGGYTLKITGHLVGDAKHSLFCKWIM